MSAGRVGWSDLPPAARAFRVAHTAWAIVSVVALGDIWSSVVTGRRGRGVVASIAWLSLEGIALIKGRGDCPFGSFQAGLGDPVPLFELALPPRAAKAAVPVLAGAAILGIALVGVQAIIAGLRSAAQRDSHQLSKAS